MMLTSKFTSADLALLPEDGNRYEIIEGELYVSRAPGYEHQFTCNRLGRFLDEWNDERRLGVVLTGPGLVFADDDDVIPDVVWLSHERFAEAVDEAGHFRLAPELVIEVLSPGRANIYRDRESKRDLYARRGAQEYWIVNWMSSQVEIYRRKRRKLALVSTLNHKEQITSPLLPGFACQVALLFFALSVGKRNGNQRNGHAGKKP